MLLSGSTAVLGVQCPRNKILKAKEKQVIDINIFDKELKLSINQNRSPLCWQ